MMLASFVQLKKQLVAITLWIFVWDFFYDNKFDASAQINRNSYI